MIIRDDLATFLPTPFVLNGDISTHSPSSSLQIPSFCELRKKRSNECSEHYKKLFAESKEGSVKCPHGFTTCTLKIGNETLTLCSYYDETTQEFKRKQFLISFPKYFVQSDVINRVIFIASRFDEIVNRRISDGMRSFVTGFHELRKFNRTIKHTSERLLKNKQENIEQSVKSDLMRINAASEMISGQLSIIEVFTAERYYGVGKITVSNIYQLLDKCKRVFDDFASDNGVSLLLENYDGVVSSEIDDKTFYLVFTILIENAIKYSIKGTQIRLSISKRDGSITVKIQNTGSKVASLDRLFDRGFRENHTTDGLGIGLYLAKKITEAHGGTLTANALSIDAETSRYSFSVTVSNVVEK